MSITFVLDSELGIVRTQIEGEVGMEEISQHLERLKAANLFATAELVDARNGRNVLTAAEVRVLADLVRGTEFTQGPRAIVAHDDVSFGMARMFAILCDNFGAPVAVFRELEPAMAWIKTRVAPKAAC